MTAKPVAAAPPDLARAVRDAIGTRYADAIARAPDGALDAAIEAVAVLEDRPEDPEALAAVAALLFGGRPARPDRMTEMRERYERLQARKRVDPLARYRR